MSTEYVPDPDWQAKAKEHASALLERVVGDILEDAKAAVPVDTGALKASLRSAIQDDVGRVGSDLDYSVWVEEGHRVAYRDEHGEKHFTGTVVPPQPYLRTALYTKRSY